MTFTGELVVELDEAGREIGRAETLEVHREERDVGQDVAVAEPSSEKSRQSSTRGPSSRQKMSSARRSPWPSHIQPSARPVVSKSARPVPS